MVLNVTTVLVGGHQETVIREAPAYAVPFTLSWSAQAVSRPVVQRFIESSLAAGVPDGRLPPVADGAR